MGEAGSVHSQNYLLNEISHLMIRRFNEINLNELTFDNSQIEIHTI